MATQRQRTYSGMLGDWQSLIGTVEAALDELPQLEPFLTKLRVTLDQVLEANRRQGAMRASKQEASKQKRRLAAEGQRLAALMRSALKEHFGVGAERLAEFGLQPFRGQFQEDPEPPEPETPEPETPDPTPPVE